jgi:FkbH-like protein
VDAEATGKQAAAQELAAREEQTLGRRIKCLVWDLDNTLWTGILAEDPAVILRRGVADLIRTLDGRGILHSVASRNDEAQALAKLAEFGLEQYFVYPQIHWGAKSTSMGAIAKSINIGIDTLAFIDDQAFERDEVQSVHPEVLCLDASEIECLADRGEFMPRFVTDESRHRREMLQADMVRNEVEQAFEGPQDQFLASLDMHLRIYPARESDLKRAEELTLRTNQLNTTGRTYSYDELDTLRRSSDYRLWVANLSDKYGSHGTIGLTLIEDLKSEWWIRLHLMSCRVMNRGVGGVVINYIRSRAREEGVRLMAEMILNSQNRMMYMTYKFNHFEEVERLGAYTIFENDLVPVQACPKYLRISANA